MENHQQVSVHTSTSGATSKPLRPPSPAATHPARPRLLQSGRGVGAQLIVLQGPELLVWLAGHSPLRQKIESSSTGTILIAGFCALGCLLFMARSLLAPGLSSLIGVAFFFMMGAISVFRSFYIISEAQ